MNRSRWLYWGLLVAFTAAAVSIVHVVVEQATRDGPNYSCIEAGLFLGGYVSEPPPGTNAVLNLCEIEDPYETEAHRWLPIADAPPAPSIDWLREQVTFIDQQRRAGRTVFVHCRNGASRSAMVMAAYLMAREGWSRDETLEALRSKRSVVRPNPTFMALLQEWDRSK